MTQNMGTSSGFLFDPITAKPTWGEAMEETLRLFSEHGHEDIQNCQGGRFARGECALTYTWNSGTILSNMGGLEVGVAPTPGSLRVMDQGTGKLENCTPSLCPFGEYYEDVGIVNRAPYAAFGDWASGVSNSTANHRETADFFSYLQSQSFQDILPNDRTDLLDPYQYKHTDAYRWINDGGIAATIAEGFSYSSLAMNSLNAVLNLRVPNSEAFLNIFDEEISSYVTDTRATLEFQESVNLREATATRMTARVENLIAAEPDFLPLYQDSIGFSTAPVEAFNYIKTSYRRVAWGMSGIIIAASIILIFWTVVFRKNPVMRAFQPFLLLQCAVGVFFMGVTIILIGLDDQMFDKDILDITCMAGPWAYVVGFTIFFSSVYCKIEGCTKILRDPQNNKVLFVSLRADALFTSRLLILNGAILAVWSVADPLRWVRRELAGGMVFPDGTVETFGMCRGAEFTSFALASILFLTNILMLLIATFRIFKCRLLVLEYNELQWLTLSLIPFLEGWIVGAPVLALSREDPTVIFSTLAFVISVSAACAGTAIFAPKDWYMRKHKYMETRSRKDSDHTSDSGILLLQHPKFENQKQLEHLQMQLEKTHALNTELEIEIRGIDERFREIRHMNDHYGPSHRMLSPLASPSSKPYATPRRSRTSQDVRVAKKTPEIEVWKMPDSEDEAEVDLSAVDIAGPLESFRKTSNGLPTPSKKNGVKAGGGESELGNLVQSDDVEALGNKADAMANEFKTGSGRALIGDGIGGVRVLSHGSSRESSPTHANTANGKKQSVGEDETEELVLESNRESVGACSMFHYNDCQPTRSHMYNSSQKPGEPSGDDSYKKEEENRLNGTVPAISASKTTSSNTPATCVPKAHSPQDPAKKVGVSFRTDTQFHVQDSVPNTTYNMGEWSAVGGTGGVLVDMSDASSYNSSANSSTLSTTSMDATMRASALDTPFAKEVDQLVPKKDWDGLQIAAKSYEPGTNTKASARNSEASIEAKKRRKRELEESFLRARSKSENDAQWV